MQLDTIKGNAAIKQSVLIGVASAFVGVKENGYNDGEFVRMFQDFIGDAQKESWCMAFVQYCVNLTDKIMYRVDHEMAQSIIHKSEHCLTVWNNTSQILRLNAPVPGCIVIWNHVGTSNGHTGIVESVDGTTMTVLEGNTGPGKGVEANGDGVYRKIRYLDTSGSKMQIKGYLKPWV
jgi:hypothetical protein